MKTRYLAHYLFAMCLFAVIGSTAAADSKLPRPAAKAEYPVIEWTDLMPPDDLEALLNPPEYLDDIEDGSPEDQLPRRTPDDKAASRYEQALVSDRVRPEYDKRKVTIPGYIVPIEFNDQMVITEFFLVPFFGACIHFPPPPPNQMVHIIYPKGIALESLYDPFFVEGVLAVKTHQNDELGTSAYSLDIARIYPYTE